MTVDLIASTHSRRMGGSDRQSSNRPEVSSSPPSPEGVPMQTNTASAQAPRARSTRWTAKDPRTGRRNKLPAIPAQKRQFAPPEPDELLAVLLAKDHLVAAFGKHRGDGHADVSRANDEHPQQITPKEHML